MIPRLSRGTWEAIGGLATMALIGLVVLGPTIREWRYDKKQEKAADSVGSVIQEAKRLEEKGRFAEAYATYRRADEGIPAHPGHAKFFGDGGHASRRYLQSELSRTRRAAEKQGFEFMKAGRTASRDSEEVARAYRSAVEIFRAIEPEHAYERGTRRLAEVEREQRAAAVPREELERRMDRVSSAIQATLTPASGTVGDSDLEAFRVAVDELKEATFRYPGLPDHFENGNIAQILRSRMATWRKEPDTRQSLIALLETHDRAQDALGGGVSLNREALERIHRIRLDPGTGRYEKAPTPSWPPMDAQNPEPLHGEDVFHVPSRE